MKMQILTKIDIMKKILLLGAALLTLVACNQPKTPATTTVENTKETSASLRIAVVNVDTLLAKYNFAVESNEALMTKQEDARLLLNQKATKLQNEMESFQRKLQNNAFLSRERAEKEQKRLMKKDQDLQLLQQKKADELMKEQQELSKQLREAINVVIAEYNKNHDYDIIISTNSLNDNVLYTKPQHNITYELLEILNAAE